MGAYAGSRFLLKPRRPLARHITATPVATRVIERGVSHGYHSSGTTQVATFPTGAAVGDLLVLLAADGYDPAIPSGWTSGIDTETNTVYGILAWKIATSGDIATGSVTYSISNSYRGAWCMVALQAGTFATQPTVASATASSNAGSQWIATNAFDGAGGDSGHAWASADSTMPQWLQAQLSTASAITSYGITARASDATQAPNTWTLQGSNDGSSWTTLDTRSGETFSNGQTKNYSFTNSTAYLYYRINITVINGGTNAAIAELILGVWISGNVAVAGLPQTATALIEVAGQRAYYYGSARADGAGSGGILTGSRGSVMFQRTSDNGFLTSLYADDVSSSDSVAAVWSSTTTSSAIFYASFAVSPAAGSPPIRPATMVRSMAAQRASRW